MKMLKEIFKPSLQVMILNFLIVFVSGKLIVLYFYVYFQLLYMCWIKCVTAWPSFSIITILYDRLFPPSLLFEEF
jgi:hypothetical protein